MCNTKPSSPPSFPSSNKTLFTTTITNPTKVLLDDNEEDDDRDQLCRWPTPSEALEEMKAIGKISGPTAITGLVMYSRAMISMLFLGYLGEVELAGGSLSIGVANITGYSVISGLAMGMEPICGQAYGGKQMKLLGLTLQRTVLLLLTASIPIAVTWANMKGILVKYCGQDEEISSVAQTFIVFSIPDLFFLSLLHPLRIYLRAQSVTLPVTYCSAVSVALHVPLNFLLVVRLRMGVSGVAAAAVLTNANLFLFVLIFVKLSGVHRDTWVAPSLDCFRGWSSLLSLALPTCVSVCLEWWWYELMIVLCGLLTNPAATVASMGILIQTTSLVYVFPSSLSLGVSARVANNLGANKPARARTATLTAMVISALTGLAAACFTASVRHSWGRLFTADSDVLRLTAAALPIAGLCELGNCPQTAGCGVLRGTARPALGANINLGSFYLVGMPVSLAAGFFFKLGFPGLWLGLLAAQATCAFLMIYALCNTDWAAQADRAKHLTTVNNIKKKIIANSLQQSSPPLPISSSSSSPDNDLQEIVVIKPSSSTVQESEPLITHINNN